MTNPSPDIYLALWDRAAEVEIGIAIKTNEPTKFRNKLLTVAAEAKHPARETIITLIPEGNDEVFMCRRTAELPD